MSGRGLLARFSTVLALLLAGALALVGGVSLPGAGVAAVGFAAVVAAVAAAGIARESSPTHPRRAVVDAAWRTAAWTVGLLLVISGALVLGGGAAPVLLAVCATPAVLGWALRGADRRAMGIRPGARSAAASAKQPPAAPPTASPSARHGTHPSGRAAGATHPAPATLPPLPSLSVEALGREWLRMSAALAAVVDPGAREQIVRRRQEELDELERRDPVGFARWLSAGATVDSDPAQYLRGDSAAGSGAA